MPLEALLSQIDTERIPRHIAIIMDGNGRWAKQRGQERSFGHQQGVTTVHHITEFAGKIGIKYLTLYAFSTENWNRPQNEVDALMTIMVMAIENETPNLIKNNVRLLVIGDLGRISPDVRERFNNSIEKTAQNTGLTLIFGLSYSARWEITCAVQQIAQDLCQGVLKKEDITEELVSNRLTTKGIPDPDLLIRTGGEIRISNFLLWQVAYSELYFTNEYWPDFNDQSLINAISEYQQRERRFGKTSEQL